MQEWQHEVVTVASARCSACTTKGRVEKPSLLLGAEQILAEALKKG